MLRFETLSRDISMAFGKMCLDNLEEISSYGLSRLEWWEESTIILASCLVSHSIAVKEDTKVEFTDEC